MNDPWFSPELAPYFSLFSLLALTAVFEDMAKKGRHKTLVMSVWTALLAFGGLLVAAAGAAVVAGQPAFVVGTLALTGTLVGAAFALTRPSIVQAYREAELRKTLANDM
jgi:hypothetical protein